MPQLFFKFLCLIQFIQQTLSSQSVQSSPTLIRKHVQEIRVSTGSKLDRITHILVSSTLMETVVVTVRRVLGLTLHRNVSISSPRTSAPLMQGLITVPWPHVGRYCLEMEQKWRLKVTVSIFSSCGYPELCPLTQLQGCKKIYMYIYFITDNSM